MGFIDSIIESIKSLFAKSEAEVEIHTENFIEEDNSERQAIARQEVEDYKANRSELEKIKSKKESAVQENFVHINSKERKNK